MNWNTDGSDIIPQLALIRETISKVIPCMIPSVEYSQNDTSIENGNGQVVTGVKEMQQGGCTKGQPKGAVLKRYSDVRVVLQLNNNDGYMNLQM